MKLRSSVFAIGARLLPLTILLSPGLASAAAEKLLLKEVVSSPNQAESVAIVNMGAAPVDLTNYYLADFAAYYLVVTQTAPANTSDFIIRFPAGASIMPGQTQYIALGGAECFKTSCGVAGNFTGFAAYPTYELAPTSMLKTSASVPDMIAPFAGAIGSNVLAANGALTNTGEPVVLFYWDGASNLVTDVDYVYFNQGTGSNPGVNKTGVAVNGSTYLADSADVAANHAPIDTMILVQTTCRADFTEGAQIMAGGNGANGSDECSENWSLTWTACAAPTANDIDADGLANPVDNCPNTANGTQDDGDSDGVGDVCDNCPADANADQMDSNSNGVGDVCEAAGSSSSSSSSGSSSSSSGSSSSSSGSSSSGSSGAGGAGGEGAGGAGGAGGSGTGGAGGGSSSSSSSGSMGSGGSGSTSSSSSGGDGGSGGTDSSGGGHRSDPASCSCTTIGGETSPYVALAALAGLAGLVVRRKRQRRA